MKHVLFLALFLIFSPLVMAKQNPVSECGTWITEPGKYRVVNDILDCGPSDGGVMIVASDVTLDLKGHTISCIRGDPPVGGVFIGWFAEVSNVRVTNGTISGCDDGLVIGFSDGARVTKISLSDNIAGGITLVEAQNSVIKNNRFFGNGTGIRSFDGSGNLFSHNTMMYDLAGIDLSGEIDSMITCNTASQTWWGISVGPNSTGNVIRGNNASDNFLTGIMAYGYGVPEGFDPVPQGNLFMHNMALNNGAIDLSEAVYNPSIDWFFVDPADECQNAWMKNWFDVELGPANCIGAPVMRDEPDVCAFDAD